MPTMDVDQRQITVAREYILATPASGTASSVQDASGENQQQINDFGGAKWYAKSGGYALGATVKLANGEIVKSTIPNNINDPNVDMTGWVEANDASLINTQQPFTGAVSRTQAGKNAESVSVKDFGAIGDGTLHTVAEWIPSRYASLAAVQVDYPHVTSTSDSIDWAAAQKHIAIVESAKRSSLFIPNDSENYVLSSPLLFTEPSVRVWGNKGASYNRGGGKNGFLLVGSTASHAIDFGNQRTSGNPADGFSCSNVGIKQMGGVATKTKDGIRFTSKTDGPDRGGVLRELSMTGLNRAIYIPHPGVSTAYATMIVDGCCLSNNNYAMFAEGNVLGLRFTGNQAEQNTLGAIHGTFNGAINISDNMLEGQPNCINIVSSPVYGSRSKLVVERNYFEAMSGDYVINYACSSSDSSVTVSDNYYFNKPANLDFLRISSSNGLTINNREPYPVVFSAAPIVKPDSQILNSAVRYFSIRSFVAGVLGPTILNSNYYDLLDDSGSHTHVIFRFGTAKETPHGNLVCSTGGSWMTIPVSVDAGDLVSINFVASIGAPYAADMIYQVFNVDYSAVVSENTLDISQMLDGQWALCTLTFKAQTASSILRFRLYCPTIQSTRFVAGIACRNYGAFVGDGTAKIDVYPVRPNFDFKLSALLDYDPPSLAAGASVAFDVTCTGAAVGDYASVAWGDNLLGASVFATVNEANLVNVRLTNSSGATLNLPNTTVLVKVVRG